MSIFGVTASRLAELRQLDVAGGAMRCQVCGCTDNYACPDRCYWVAPGLCSTCLADAAPAINEQRSRTEHLLNAPVWQRVATTLDGDRWIAGGMSVIWSIIRELDGRLWMHLSVARPDRLPSYTDMTRVKSLFVGEERVAYTVMPAASNHVNIHETCLHLWMPIDQNDLPLPDFTRGQATI